MSAPTQPLDDEFDRCKAEACKAGGEAFAALTQADIQTAERHFARASRLLQRAMDMLTARRLLDRNDVGTLERGDGPGSCPEHAHPSLHCRRCVAGGGPRRAGS